MSGVRSRTDESSSPFTFRDAHSNAPKTTTPHWWMSGSVYQIWPASFKDGNGDGLGDLPGILSKLDYLKDLGIDVVWLSPMYASPQVDMGYDIADYESVHPPYGTLDDMKTLIKGLHDRGIRLILDLVINHTSDQHLWFQESKKRKQGPKSDWYIWRDPKIVNGKKEPPNNWGGAFGGSTWSYCDDREQFYLHVFSKEQPDLNWERDAVRDAIRRSALEFWFERGVDGFRIDTANLYSKNQQFPDAKVDKSSAPFGNPFLDIVNGPRMHEFYQEIRSKVLDKHGDPLMVGELSASSFEQILDYVSADRRELSMVFDFDIAMLGNGFTFRKDLKNQDLIASPGAWATVFLENHDVPRSISRHGTTNPLYHSRACKLLALLLTTLSGTLFIYQGQEIGMTDIPESTWSSADLRDLDGIRYWNEMNRLFPNDREMLQKAWHGICAIGRDNARTPVQWSSEAPNAGFSATGVEPWMRVNENYKHINVASQMDDPDSLHGFWKKMLKMRKELSGLFERGAYQIYDHEDLNTFTYRKTGLADGKAALVALNFSETEHEFKFPPDLEGRDLRLAVTNIGEIEGSAVQKGVGKSLGPWEARLYIEPGAGVW